MTFLILPAAGPLTQLVAGYWFVQDLPGIYQGQPIRTNPHPGAVLSVNFGRPNAMLGGPVVPRASLLGLQTIVRRWQSWADTYFVMAMLTVRGLATFFPHTGTYCRDRLVELHAIVGDRLGNALCDDLSAAGEPRAVADLLDRWLMMRLETAGRVRELPRLAAAHELMRRGASVDAAATAIEITRRQLHRWFNTHLGVGPKQLMDLERLQASLRAVQQNRGDPVSGFSDQAQQVRSWRKRLGTTPGAYRREHRSPLTEHFRGPGPNSPLFYL